MTAAYVTIVGKMKTSEGEEQDVTICGMADVISFTPGSPPPRPHPDPNPPGIWGGGNVPMPTPPIPIYPGGTPNPPGIWGGGNQPFPTPPISLPGLPGWEPPVKPDDPPKLPLEPVIAWTPDTGWVVVYVPTGEHVAPSK